MANKIETGRLYGVISQILPDGNFIKCEPVFVDAWLYKHPSAYYLGIKQSYDKRTGISQFEEVDIQTYGKTVFLPANHKKVNDGKTYTSIKQLSMQNRINETARLMGGSETESVLNAANEMINIYNDKKKKLIK